MDRRRTGVLGVRKAPRKRRNLPAAFNVFVMEAVTDLWYDEVAPQEQREGGSSDAPCQRDFLRHRVAG